MRNYDWEFDAAAFENYCAKIESGDLFADEYVGCVRVGELCFDLVLRELEKDRLTLTFDLYVGGVNSGYGYSKIEPEYPYDEADGEAFSDDCTGMTYAEFQAMAIGKFENYIQIKHLEDKADMPLHKW